MFKSIPRNSIHTISSGSKMLLRPAGATVIAVVRTVCALTGIAIVTRVAVA
jgi:hypothetical protein